MENKTIAARKWWDSLSDERKIELLMENGIINIPGIPKVLSDKQIERLFREVTLPKTKFLLSVDPENHELYILHREFPACLIWVKQETPVRFIVQDLYDEMEDPNEILGMDFVQEAKDFFKNYSASLFGGN